MLSPEERKEIESEFEKYPSKQALTIDALKIVQQHRGWISDEALKDIAEVLEVSVDDVDSVATFYNLIYRKPVGRHVILVCDSISCWVVGYDRLREQLSSRLGIKMGETTADGRFTMLPIVCLGTCDHAPAMLVDSDLHRDIDPEKIDSILDQYK